MSEATTDTIPAPGRPVRLVPVAPGFWMTAVGVIVAALAPLLGFLVGVMTKRPDDPALLNPIYLGLFTGVIIGGVGVLSAVVGGIRLWRHHQGTKA